MRLIFTLITGLTLMGMITIAWYATMPIILAISATIIGSITGEGLSVAHLVQFGSIIWGPLFDGIVLFWMIASAQARDVESSIYG